MNGINEHERQELLALYQATTQDLVSFKDQQFTVTNYALVALAAMVGVTQLSGVAWSCGLRSTLAVAAVVVISTAAWLIWRLQGSIQTRRDRLDRVYGNLSDTFRNARGGSQGRVNPKTMAAVLTVFLFAGLALTCWLILTMKPH